MTSLRGGKYMTTLFTESFQVQKTNACNTNKLETEVVE